MIEDKSRLRKKALLGEQTSITDEKTELESNITKSQAEKDASEKNLIELRGKEQELISTSGTSVSQLAEFDEQLDERDRKSTRLNSSHT